ncbi:hypothetical protein ACFFIX_03535 [Metabacillus herbersteinensis]|uniref:YqzE family protein n=1 Tax=Metabacillus herbersteinensis TaxID=283816 RepID=A0ABV6GA22_9BACI
MKKMIKSLVKWAPIIYPIARKILNKRKMKKSYSR